MLLLKSTRKLLQPFFRSLNNIETSFDKVLYCEALGDYVKVHLTNKTFIITTTMKGILADLPSDQFMRTHKSYIINKTKFEYIEGNQIKIDKHMVSIGQSYREEVFRQLS